MIPWLKRSFSGDKGKDPVSEEDLARRFYRSRKAYCIPWILSPVEKLKDNERDNTVQRRLSIAAPEREFIISKNEEETWAELFYDLFFVANLSAFTDLFDLKDSGAMRSYISFFAILWFTWLQVTVFDARFAKDSIFERLCRGLQIGSMVGFATLGVRLHISEVDTYASSFKAMSIFLFVSRITLAIQYFVVWLYIHREKRHKLVKIKNKEYWSFFCMWVSNILTTLIYLGIYFAFSPNKKSSAWIGWHCITFFEVILMFALSTMGKGVSLQGTHLVHRMGLMTLIMIGEGILGTTTQVGVINTMNQFDAHTSIATFCVMASIYFLWMLCFDGYPHERWEFGPLKHLIWIAMQFPLHLWIVLFVACASRIPLLTNVTALWAKIDAAFTANFIKEYNAAQSAGTLQDLETVYENAINDTLTTTAFFIKNPQVVDQLQNTISSFLDEVSYQRDPAGILHDTRIYSQALVFALFLDFFKLFKFASPLETSYTGVRAKAIMTVRFSQVSLGSIFITLAIQRTFMMHLADKIAWLQVVVRLAWGLGLVIHAALAAPTTMGTFAASPWAAPVLALHSAGLVLLDKVIVHLATFRYERRNSGNVDENKARRQSLSARQFLEVLFKNDDEEEDEEENDDDEELEDAEERPRVQTTNPAA